MTVWVLAQPVRRCSRGLGWKELGFEVKLHWFWDPALPCRLEPIITQLSPSLGFLTCVMDLVTAPCQVAMVTAVSYTHLRAHET